MEDSVRRGARYVITGAPSAGKTTTLREIARRGYRTGYDPARQYIEERLVAGETLERIRRHNPAFQNAVIARRAELERSFAEHHTVFLDCGLHDNIAFLRWSNDEPSVEQRELIGSLRYDTAFLLEFAQLETDHVRTEGFADSCRMERLMREAYEEAGIPIVWVPWQPVLDRADQVLGHLGLE